MNGPGYCWLVYPLHGCWAASAAYPGTSKGRPRRGATNMGQAPRMARIARVARAGFIRGGIVTN